MASVWRHPKSPYWSACFRGPDDKKLKRSTKQADKRIALKIAQDWEREADKASHRSILQSQLESVVVDIYQRATGEEFSIYTVKSWFEQFLKEKAQKAQKSSQRFWPVSKQFLESLGAKQDLPIHKVTRDDVKKFIEERRRNGASVSTANMDLRYIREVFNKAKDYGYIQINPANQVDRIRETEQLKRRPLTEQHTRKLLKVAKGEWKTAILLGHYTGARLSDIKSLKWDQLNFDKKGIELSPQKTKWIKGADNDQVLFMHPALEKHLLSLKRTNRKDSPILSKLSKRRVDRCNGLSDQFLALLKKAAIAESVKRDNGRTFNYYSFHSYRHGWVSRLVNSGVPQSISKKMTGHASDSIHAHYTHPDFALIQEATLKFEDVTSG